MIQLTESAILEAARLLAKQPNPALGLRVGVRGGGCSGLSYQLAFTEKQNNDHELSFGSVRVYVDPKSILYLKGITVDFVDGLENRGFKFVNPNAQKTCGCGESFSV